MNSIKDNNVLMGLLPTLLQPVLRGLEFINQVLESNIQKIISSVSDKFQVEL